ncbi:MAG: CDP-alcohol phosphatidyltransferase family protein [Bacteroidales bacterium]|nr:CDP-alcohol phosphatidyltransferase family protein [Bacteroidales bacterium]
MKPRDQLDVFLHRVITPLADLFIKLGITPNMLTVAGAVISLVAAAMIAVEGWEGYQTGLAGTSVLAWASLVMLLGSLFDMFDGHVARCGHMHSQFGALLDSVTDRLCEIATLLSISFYFFGADELEWVLVTFLALLGSVMVSYVRARAEGLGVECKTGLMQRPERVVITCLGCLLSGLFACSSILGWSLAVIALFANATALKRLVHCRRELAKRES